MCVDRRIHVSMYDIACTQRLVYVHTGMHIVVLLGPVLAAYHHVMPSVRHGLSGMGKVTRAHARALVSSYTAIGCPKSMPVSTWYMVVIWYSLRTTYNMHGCSRMHCARVGCIYQDIPATHGVCPCIADLVLRLISSADAID